MMIRSEKVSQTCVVNVLANTLRTRGHPARLMTCDLLKIEKNSNRLQSMRSLGLQSKSLIMTFVMSVNRPVVVQGVSSAPYLFEALPMKTKSAAELLQIYLKAQQSHGRKMFA